MNALKTLLFIASLAALPGFLVAQDSDNDGLLDAVEPFIGATVGAADSDNDGLLDGEEVLRETLPGVPDSDNDGVNDAEDDHPNNADIARDNDKDWIPDAIDPDDDNDGLPDRHEATHGTDPLSADSDNDNLGDLYEVKMGYNPRNADTDLDGFPDEKDPFPTTPAVDLDTLSGALLAEDTDRDGLTNGQEKTLGTNPNDADSDGDGLEDGTEISRGLDPREADFDGDGLIDGLEVLLKTDPKTAEKLSDTRLNLGQLTPEKRREIITFITGKNPKKPKKKAVSVVEDAFPNAEKPLSLRVKRPLVWVAGARKGLGVPHTHLRAMTNKPARVLWIMAEKPLKYETERRIEKPFLNDKMPTKPVFQAITVVAYTADGAVVERTFHILKTPIWGVWIFSLFLVLSFWALGALKRR